SEVCSSDLDREAERLVKGDALLQIVDSQGGNDRADLHSFLRCRHDSLLLFRLVSFLPKLAGRARIFKRGRAKGILRERTSLDGSGRAGAAVARAARRDHRTCPRRRRLTASGVIAPQTNSAIPEALWQVGVFSRRPRPSSAAKRWLF